ncbi:DUF2795 domain-containing protein [Leucobacter sp. CSA1]|uniref:DUF2795 domain-containing protein n=1 Tax=Leucobacter chromiisoli TaxID=2796471 RepID=A0A934UVZ2_9MICO|nr:DUF2795 domain-containing protein [Leucobacter chromiisoli]MBK0419733.1 DUF2795 domain-containing protein [Leucobacter chromiisoli]
MANTPNPIQVQKHLGGIDYPASKEEILDQAKASGADDEVMRALEGIADKRYEKPTDVSAELG